MSSMEVGETEALITPKEVKVAEEKPNLHNATGDFGISTAPEHEQFVGFQLTADEKEYVWDPEVTPVKSSILSGSTSILQVNQYSRLLVKQAILSPDAADGELNCVEVEGCFPRSLNKMPLAILSGGKDMQRYLDVYFPEPPLTFRLTHGNGPVFILAQSMIENNEDDSDEEGDFTAEDTADEEEEAAAEEGEGEAEEEEAEAEESPVKSKKRKASPPAKVKGKSKKTKVEPEVEDEEEEEEDEESEEEAEPSPLKKKGKAAKSAKSKAKGKAAKAEVEEEEDEESEEGEDEPEPPKKKGRAAKAKPKAARKGRK